MMAMTTMVMDAPTNVKWNLAGSATTMSVRPYVAMASLQVRSNVNISMVKPSVGVTIAERWQVGCVYFTKVKSIVMRCVETASSLRQRNVMMMELKMVMDAQTDVRWK